MGDFRSELTALLNTHSKENGSDTPDFILAQYLIHSLEAFDKATDSRERWYGRTPDCISASAGSRAEPPAGPSEGDACLNCGMPQRFHYGSAQTCPGLRKTTVWRPTVSAADEERSAPGKRHRCMRCGGEFACRTAGCTAGYDVLPRIVQRAPDGSLEVVEHECIKADEERIAPQAPPICPDCGGRGWPTAHDLCPTCHGDPGPAAPQEGEK